jgi:hypothetical protein
MSSNNNLTLECEQHGEKWLGSLSPFKKPIKFMSSFTNKVGVARYIHKLIHHNPFIYHFRAFSYECKSTLTIGFDMNLHPQPMKP